MIYECDGIMATDLIILANEMIRQNTKRYQDCKKSCNECGMYNETIINNSFIVDFLNNDKFHHYIHEITRDSKEMLQFIIHKYEEAEAIEQLRHYQCRADYEWEQAFILEYSK